MLKFHYYNRAILFCLATFVSGCDNSRLDLDLRNNEFDISNSQGSTNFQRSRQDNRGVISYPNYQIAIARKNDTLISLANRIGIAPEVLAQHNKINLNETLNAGQAVAIPGPYNYRDNFEGEDPLSEGINIIKLASNALEKASQTNTSSKKTNKGQFTHKVKRGETVFTISRLYNISIRSLSEINSLDSDFTIKEGQDLLIPSSDDTLQNNQKEEIEKPGAGSTTPIPPEEPNSALSDSNDQKEKSAKEITLPETPINGMLTYPVKGKIIREYVKGKTDGIDLSAPEGTTIVAAASGLVAAITADADQVPIVVIKHKNDLLTVYANLGEISVSKGEFVNRGQFIGKIRAGNPAYLHFEVRDGFESLDPMDFLE